MKKVVIVSIIIAVAAILAVFVAETGFFNSAEVEKPAVMQEIGRKDLEKNVKIAPKMKMPKIKTIDRAKLKESLKKRKEKQEKAPNFQENYKKCGE